MVGSNRIRVGLLVVKVLQRSADPDDATEPTDCAHANAVGFWFGLRGFDLRNYL
jgi:hypothetical protein